MPGVHQTGQKFGLYALLAILAFASVFAVLPGANRGGIQTGATLEGVQLALYPGRDPDAVWSFAAARVVSDPVAGETRLTGLSGGERRVKERGPEGQLTGREVLDARLTAPELTIDTQDNMMTRQARITLVQQCADIELKGTANDPVKIEQGSGFSAPVAEMTSPMLNGHVERLKMTFDFHIEDADDQHSSFTSDLDSTARCVNGQFIPGT